MKKKILLTTGAFGLAILATSFSFATHIASATVPGVNSLISINSTGTASGNSTLTSSGILSANGNYVVFSDAASNIVSGDTNSHIDIFARNLTTNTTSRVSVSSSGVQANGDSTGPAVSETGRYITFSSSATNLIDGSTTSSTYPQLYLRDTANGTTTLISQNSSGTLADGYINAATISSDGRFVLISSNATDLNSAVTNGGYNYYMLDRTTGIFSVLNNKYDGTIPAITGIVGESMSCDGSIVAFVSGTQLTTQATTHSDIYLLDLRSGAKLTNLTGPTNGAGYNPSVSCNGDTIGLASDGTNLDSSISVTSGCRAYVYDRIGGGFSLIERSTSGTVGNGSSTCGSSVHYGPNVAVSDNRTAIFDSYSNNLTSISNSGYEQVYVRNLDTGVTEMLSQDSGGTAANNKSQYPTISARGSLAAYRSGSTNLTSTTDTNGGLDAFTSQTGY